MTATANIISATKDNTYAYLTVMVVSDSNLPDGTPTNVEYNAQTPLLNPDGTTKSNAQLKSELVALCKSQRDAQKIQIQTLAISGNVTL